MTDANEAVAAEMVGVTKRFRDKPAVQDVSLAVTKGEFLSLLGPSGCGKTTMLRMFGGFLRPDEGEIRLAGKSVSGVPPHRRDVNTVFQSYALFAHLTVGENVAFGLRRRRVSRDQVREQVQHMLEVVSLQDRIDAKPAELSGGQQQRVALARALVNMPSLLLLDEPLAALDLKLRRQMQLELKHIQQQVGIAFVFVTHDQEEALTMSDRVAVMDHGHVLQVGTPNEIYNHPSDLFVAQFVGSTNAMSGRLRRDRLELPCGIELQIPGRGIADGEELTACIRPEKLTIEPLPPGAEPRPAGFTVIESVYRGAAITYRMSAGDGTAFEALVTNTATAAAPIAVGTPVAIGWQPQDWLIFDSAGRAMPAANDLSQQPPDAHPAAEPIAETVKP